MRGVCGVVQDNGRGAHPRGAVEGVACEEVDTAVNWDEDEWY